MNQGELGCMTDCLQDILNLDEKERQAQKSMWSLSSLKQVLNVLHDRQGFDLWEHNATVPALSIS